MRKINVNGKEYEVAPYTVNTDCDLEEMGISIIDMRNRTMSFIRAYVALSIGCSVKEAGKELNEHFVNVGDFSDILSAISDEINESDFFQKKISNMQEIKEKKSKKEKAEEITEA